MTGLSTPSTHGGDGVDRGPGGRFLPGNKAGRGNPLAGQAAKLRAAMFRAVKVGSVKRIVDAMIQRAMGGDVAAARLVLSYTLGEPRDFDLEQRLQALEAVLLDREQ